MKDNYEAKFLELLLDWKERGVIREDVYDYLVRTSDNYDYTREEEGLNDGK